MKRFLRLIILLLCVGAISSCEGLNFDSLFEAESDSIAGTQWQHVEYNTPAGTVLSILSFSTTSFTLSVDQSMGTNQTYRGNYEYSRGSGTLYLDGDPAYISVSGYDLTLSWAGTRLSFTKK